MKYVKIFSLAALAALALVACQKTNYPEFSFGPEQDADPVSNPITEVYFSKTSAEEEIDPAAETYDITVSRTNTTGALSVPVIVEDPAGIFKVPNTIEFADGAATTTLTVDISGMELETVYDLVISVPIDYFYTYMDADYYAKEKGIDLNNDKYSFHLNALKQKWIPAGTCTFGDSLIPYLLQMPVEYAESTNVVIQQHEGTNDYRMVNPYDGILPAPYYTPANLLFSVIPDKEAKWNKIVFKEGLQNLWPGIGYYFYWDPTNYSSYCYVEYDEGEKESSITVWVTYLVVKGSSIWSYFDFYFDWDGYPFYEE